MSPYALPGAFLELAMYLGFGLILVVWGWWFLFAQTRKDRGCKTWGDRGQ